MKRAFLITCLLGMTSLALQSVNAQTHSTDFTNASAWQTKGEAALDSSMNRPDSSGGSLRIGPGGEALWNLRETNDSGKVELWVFDDMTVPAKPKERRVGPRWGLLQSNGHMLTVGAIYAPYLSGATTHASSDYNGSTWFNVQYLATKRKQGWNKWTFDLDPDKGLRIALNGVDVNAKRQRFNWNKTGLKGFVGMVVMGDEKKGEGQTVWIDDVSATLGGPMKAVPVPPPPPPPVVPLKDPVVENPARLVDSVMGKHPRLLFFEEDLPALRAFAKGSGKPYFDHVADYAPKSALNDTKFLTDATDGQRKGLWQLPSLALHWSITRDERSRKVAVEWMEKLLSLEHWDTSKERDSGMGAGNVMFGAALIYDCLYDELDPAFREQYRQKLLLHARRLYHRGHLKKGGGTAYWQNDPQNNHRWHRDIGLLACVIAANEGNPEEDWILTKAYEEAAYVARWLPDDGSCHEGSGYMVFGGAHLALVMQMADRCFGTNYMDLPHFKNSAGYRLQMMAPGLKTTFSYGDAGGVGSYNNYTFHAAATHGLSDVQAGLIKMSENHPSGFWLGWMSMLWVDPELEVGSVDNLPLNTFHSDLGIAFMRDGWGEGDIAASFKCGPYGGAKLNEFRNTHDFAYVNIAHDDPDANSFQLFARGAMLAETSRYSKKKLTASHNTILVNGKGQQGEGAGWTQPTKRGDKDMTKSGWITNWVDNGDIAIVEGEAGGFYRDLERFRRVMIWVKGKYVLVLDDIHAPREVEVTWLVQAPETTVIDETTGRFRLAKDKAACEFHVTSNQPFSINIVDSTADHRGKPLGWQQLQLTAIGKSVRFASVLSPWGESLPMVGRRVGDKSDTMTVTVAGSGFTDTWQWRATDGQFEPYSLTGRRAGGFSVSFPK